MVSPLAGRACSQSSRLLTCALTLAIVGCGFPARAAEWRVFGVERVFGHLVWNAESKHEQDDGGNEDSSLVEQQARLYLASYVFHPRFLAVTADTTAALRRTDDGDSGFKNLDTAATLSFLQQGPFNFGLTGRIKPETKEHKFQDYERDTVGSTVYVNLRGKRHSTNLKLETSEVESAEVLPENRFSRYLTVQSDLRLPSINRASLRLQSLNTDDRLSSLQTRYLAADAAATLPVFSDRGSLSATVGAWTRTADSEASGVTLRQNWVMNWDQATRSYEDAELSQHQDGSKETTVYRLGGEVSRAISEAWRLSGSVGATFSDSSDSRTAVYRISGAAGYLGRWNGNRVAMNNLLALAQSQAGPSRRLSVFGELRYLPLHGELPGEWVALANPYVDEATIKVYDPELKLDWTAFCRTQRIGNYTYIRWDPQPTDPAYPNPAGETLEVRVDYEYLIPEAKYNEVSDALSLVVSRDLAPGVGVETSLTVNSVVPGALGTNTFSTRTTETEYDLGLQGHLKRDTHEVSAGGSVGSDRQSLFVRGSAEWQSWKLSQYYRSDTFPDEVGQTFEFKASRLWGLSEKSNLSVEIGDQTHLVDSETQRGLTFIKASTAMLFTPFIRLEVEGRAQTDRSPNNDSGLALSARYRWRQGQLDLVCGYEHKTSAGLNTQSRKVYGTIIRRF